MPVREWHLIIRTVYGSFVLKRGPGFCYQMDLDSLFIINQIICSAASASPRLNSFLENSMNPMKSNVSPLQAVRVAYLPKLPKVLAGKPSKAAIKSGKPTKAVSDQEAMRGLFPATYGQPEVFFIPGKAP